MFLPGPRYRFYGTPANYFTALRHFLWPERDAGGSESRLEKATADKVGVRHARCVPQARYGIYLVLRQLIEPGQTVVMSPYTIYDVVNMVLCAGGRPIFADISRETCNVRPDEVERLIDQRTGAVMVTHLHGLACEIEEIAEICRRKGVPLLEDAAQAFGARVDGRMLGSFGDAGVYSFGRAKNINAFFGGMIVTDRGDLYEGVCSALGELPYEGWPRLAKRIAQCLVGDLMTLPPIFWLITFRIFRFGALRNVESVNRIVQTEASPKRRDAIPEHYHRRMTPMQADVAGRQLASLDRDGSVRQRFGRIYHEGLRGAPGVGLPPLRDDGSHVYLQFPIRVKNRWQFVRYMMRNGRDVAIQHMRSAAEIDVFREFPAECPNARSVADSLVLLPTYPGYGEAEVLETMRVARRYFDALGAEDSSFAVEDVAALAEMHRACLPNSLVTRMGSEYGKAFYRFLRTSPLEKVFIEKDGEEILGACVLSLEPESLTRRLVTSTPVIRSALRSLPRLVQLVRNVVLSSRRGERQPSGPELLMIFTLEHARGRGLGARMLETVEQYLHERGCTWWWVKTLDDPRNRAIDFYLGNHFTRQKSITRNGKRLCLLRKELGKQALEASGKPA